MQFLSTKRERKAGFTLVEMLVVAPIVILVIATFVGYIVTITGDGLQTRQKNALVYNTQASLDDIESIGTRAVGFLATTGALPSPQGSDDATAEFKSTDNALIMKSAATDKSMFDETRSVIFSGPGACNPLNRVYTYTTIYFVKTSENALYKRTILSNGLPACDTQTPYQRNSCSPTKVSSSTRCKAEDEKLMDNVTSMDVSYYSSSSSDTAVSDPTTADTVNVTISSGKKSAGKQISYSGTLRFTTINSKADIGQSSTTKLSANESMTSTSPDVLTCSWDSAGNNMTYNVSFSVNGTALSGSPFTTTSLSANLNISNYRGKSIACNVSVDTGYDTITYDTVTYSVPIWTDCTLENSWQNYGSNYATLQFYRTSANTVIMKGLIKGGSTTVGSRICQLPEGYRPSGRIVFENSSGTTALAARLDVDSDGSIYYMSGNNGYLSLTNINFQTNATWTTLTGSNNWVAYGGAYSAPQVTKDNLGRGHIQGLAKSGTTNDGTLAFSLPSGYGTGVYIHYPSISGNNTPTSMAIDSNTIKAKGNSNSATYWSLQAMFYPSSSVTWNNASLQNGWATYSSSFPTGRYAKSSDNIVSLQGLVKGGTTTSGTTMFTLPAGYRPNEIHACAVSTAGNTYARIDVYPDGRIVTRDNISSTFVSFGGCDFLAEQ